MAGRPKKETTEETVENKVENNTDMTLLLKQMQEQIALLQSQLNEKNESVQPQNNSSELYKSIKVISLVPYTVVIATEGNSRSVTNRKYVFDKYGKSFAIPVTELQKIMSHCESLFSEGILILGSKSDYELLMLEHLYANVNNKTAMDKILKLETDEDVEIILQFSKELKEAVSIMIAEKINSGKVNDYNKIQRLVNNGMDVTKIAETLKESNK